MDDVLPHRFGLREGELRIVLGILGETVMGEVEVAEPVGRQRDRQAAEAGDSIVEPLRLEGRPVHRLMRPTPRPPKNGPVASE